MTLGVSTESSASHKIIKFAFTLAETILTMTILGIIAAVMVTTIKPAQYRDQAFNTLKKKTYKDLYTATDTLMMECCKDANATEIHNDCDLTKPTHPFGDDSGLKEATLYARYLKGTVAASSGTAVDNCAVISNYTAMKLKNGACIYFGSNSIQVDVNGSEGPNDDGDRMDLTIDSDGIATAMDDAIKTTFSGGESGSEQGGEQGENQQGGEQNEPADCSQFGSSCNACSESACTACGDEKILHNGSCSTCSDVYGSDCTSCTESACTGCGNEKILHNGSCISNENLPRLNDCSQFGKCPECTAQGCICPASYKATESGCVYGINGCIKYAESGVCTQCQDSHALLSDGTCKWCNSLFGSECSKCTASGCTKCYAHHSVISDGSCFNCKTFGEYCAECTESGCTKCRQIYSLQSDGSCKICAISNCYECTGSTCTKCKDGYRVLSNGKCQSCYAANCLECDESGCTKCAEGYRLSNGVCLSCSSRGTHCIECNESGCIKCKAYTSTWLSNGSCVSN